MTKNTSSLVFLCPGVSTRLSIAAYSVAALLPAKRGNLSPAPSLTAMSAFAVRTEKAGHSALSRRRLKSSVISFMPILPGNQTKTGNYSTSGRILSPGGLTLWALPLPAELTSGLRRPFTKFCKTRSTSGKCVGVSVRRSVSLRTVKLS